MEGSRPERAVVCKVAVLGNCGVGKTCLANALQGRAFNEVYQPTIGAGYCCWHKEITMEGGTTDIEIQAWDTGGAERYRSLGSLYYRDSVGLVLVCDQGDQESADALRGWLDDFRQVVSGSVVVGVACNKDDLEVGQKVVDVAAVEEWAKAQGFLFGKTSAKTGHGVQEFWGELALTLATERCGNVVARPGVMPAASHRGRCRC